jgi:hypothetical protein
MADMAPPGKVASTEKTAGFSPYETVMPRTANAASAGTAAGRVARPPSAAMVGCSAGIIS